jgi:O-succinylhomoserine sulfhydrylase
MNDLRFETKALHAGYDELSGGNIFPPLHMGVAFPFPDGHTAEMICAGEIRRPVYARTANPTNLVFERRMAELEGGEACLATASGLAAIFTATLGLLKEPGDEFVTSNRLYGNTQNQFRISLPLMNIQARWVAQPDDLANWEEQITPRTRFLFVESPSNPDLFVGEIAGLAKLAEKHGIKLMVDSTLATPAVMRPLELGAHVVVHSTTKYLAGHSAALGGAIIGRNDFIDELRAGHHHYIGATMSAFNAWLTLIGMETLGIRMVRAIANAQQIAEFLEKHPRVQSVNYPGLKNHPRYKVALAQMGGGGTSLLSFVVGGGKEGAWSVIEKLKIPIHATHLGGNQSIVVHPATTTHGSLTPEQRAASGVPDGLIRYSVGLEAPEDLIADLAQALS